MPEIETRPVAAEAFPAHPEEMRAEFDLRVGRHVTLQGRARITPAGVICTGISLALVGFALGYLARSLPRRRQ